MRSSNVGLKMKQMRTLLNETALDVGYDYSEMATKCGISFNLISKSESIANGLKKRGYKTSVCSSS